MVENELNELGSSMEDRLAGREFCEGAELTALDSGNTRVTKASSWLVVNSALWREVANGTYPVRFRGRMFLNLPLPCRLVGGAKGLAADQQSGEIYVTWSGIIVAQETLVQDAQVRVAGDEGNCDDGVDGMGACLLCNGEQDGGAMAVEPSRAGLFASAGVLEALGEKAKHVVAKRKLRRRMVVRVFKGYRTCDDADWSLRRTPRRQCTRRFWPSAKSSIVGI